MTKLLKWIYQLGYDKGYLNGRKDVYEEIYDQNNFMRIIEKMSEE